MDNIEYKLNTNTEEYPTKIVITHDLIDGIIPKEGNSNIYSGNSIEGDDALKVILLIKDKGYSKKDIRDKLVKISNKLIEMFD